MCGPPILTRLCDWPTKNCVAVVAEDFPIMSTDNNEYITSEIKALQIASKFRRVQYNEHIACDIC